MKKRLFSCYLFLLVSSPLLAAVSDDGLIGFWPFNGNANDESGQNNHGTAYGATLTTDRFGTDNSAYVFDGNDKIIVPDSDSLDRTGPLSFSVWVKPETLSNTRMVLGKSNYTSTTNYLLRVKSDGYIQWEYAGYTETGSSPLQLSTWHHLVVTATGPGLVKKIYIDNVLRAMTPSSTGPSGAVTNPLTFGYASYNSEYFIGTIDDIRMYDKELSLPEIEALYLESGPKTELIFSNGFE
jgi:hypothetical protein